MTYDGVIKKLEKLANKYKNVYFLNREFVDVKHDKLGTIRIAGCTLWTNV